MWPTIDALHEARRNGSGQNVKVAILDTGIDQAHGALSSARFGQSVAISAIEGGYIADACPTDDLYGHGTAVAGIIHALAPAAELISIRVLDCRKRQHRHDAIKCGALYAIESGAHILNCSFGMPGASYSLPIYKSWTDRAFELNRHVVAASSNAHPDEPEWPAYFPQVLAATAGPLAPDEIRSRPGSLVSLQAAGIDIPVLAPDQGAAVLTGSSFAAAHLSGLLARILSRFSDLSSSFVHDALHGLANSNPPTENG